MRADRHRRALACAGWLRGIESTWWPKIVVKLLGERRAWSLGRSCKVTLKYVWSGVRVVKEGCRGRNWKREVKKAMFEVPGREWRAELSWVVTSAAATVAKGRVIKRF